MRLRLIFGEFEPKRDINWWQKPMDFPHLVLYKGRKWQFAMVMEDPNKQVDHLCYFEQVFSYDPNFHADTYVNIDHYFNEGYGDRCQCGAAYTSFPQIHMFYCPKWSKW